MTYIDRDAAIKRFSFATLDCFGMEPKILASDVVEALKSIPAADVRPVVHGRWVKDCERVMGDGWTYTQRHCSVCGWQTVECVNYCPNCGALMKDGDGDGTIN